MEGDLNGDRRSDLTVDRMMDVERLETERSGTRRHIELFPWSDLGQGSGTR